MLSLAEFPEPREVDKSRDFSLGDARQIIDRYRMYGLNDMPYQYCSSTLILFLEHSLVALHTIYQHGDDRK
jgi:hypothetical protein